MTRTMHTSARHVRHLGLAALLLAVTLAIVGGVQAKKNPPLVTLDPISVGDGTAVVSGSVGGETTAEAHLEINGQPVGVDTAGDFSAVVDLEDEAALVLSLTGVEDETVTIRIPFAALLESGGEGVLDALNDAGITIDVPPDGFQIVDGQMPVVSGKVLNDENLASFTANDKEILTVLDPDGGFSVQVPGSGSQDTVTFAATGPHGVSQTSAFRASHVSTTIKTKTGTSVSAAGARGVAIAKVHFIKKNLKAKRLGVVVTVKDRRGFLIRGAALRLKAMPFRYVANGANRASFTNRLGQGKYTYRLRNQAFTDRSPRRLTLLVRASTPRAWVKKKVSLRLPTVLPT